VAVKKRSMQLVNQKKSVNVSCVKPLVGTWPLYAVLQNVLTCLKENGKHFGLEKDVERWLGWLEFS
jgi:hypothetical protein